MTYVQNIYSISFCAATCDTTIGCKTSDILTPFPLTRFGSTKPDEKKILWCFFRDQPLYICPQKDCFLECTALLTFSAQCSNSHIYSTPSGMVRFFSCFAWIFHIFPVRKTEKSHEFCVNHACIPRGFYLQSRGFSMRSSRFITRVTRQFVAVTWKIDQFNPA